MATCRISGKRILCGTLACALVALPAPALAQEEEEAVLQHLLVNLDRAQTNLDQARDLIAHSKKLDPAEARLVQSRVPQAQRALDELQRASDRLVASATRTIGPFTRLAEKVSARLEPLHLDGFARLVLLDVGVGVWMVRANGWRVMRTSMELEHRLVDSNNKLVEVLAAVDQRLSEDAARCACKCVAHGGELVSRGKMKAEDCRATCQAEGLDRSYCQ